MMKMSHFLQRFTRKILDCAIMIFAYFTGFWLSLMNDKIFFYNIKFLAFLFRIFDRRRRRDCVTNLNLAFGDSLPQGEKERIINRAYQNFAFVILNAARLICMDKEKTLFNSISNK
ncbi:LpxL/LpxP family acyltransferase [Helicobacter sp. 23-1044]